MNVYRITLEDCYVVDYLVQANTKEEANAKALRNFRIILDMELFPGCALLVRRILFNEDGVQDHVAEYHRV